MTVVLEDLGVEVHEDLYMASVIPTCKPNEVKTNYFKSYFSAEGRYICSLIETREFVSDGTTGLKTWYRIVSDLTDFHCSVDHTRAKSSFPALYFGIGSSVCS